MLRFIFFTILGLHFTHATSQTDAETAARGAHDRVVVAAVTDTELQTFPRPSSTLEVADHPAGEDSLVMTPMSDGPHLWRPMRVAGVGSTTIAINDSGSREPFAGDHAPPPSLQSATGSQEAALSRSHRQPTTDKETLELPDKAPYAPTSCILCFKHSVVAGANLMSFACRILSGFSATVAGIGVSNFLSNDSIFGGASPSSTPAPIFYNATNGTAYSVDSAPIPSVTTMITVWGSIGAVFFKSLENSLTAIGKREEIRLLSYEQPLRQFAQEAEGKKTFTNEELHHFLLGQNKFVTFPGKVNLTVQLVAYNGLCFLESVSELLLAMCTSVTASTTTSGITNINLLHLESMDTYRKLTLILGLATGTLWGLEKKRRTLKQSCEDWLVNHRMARLYLIWVQQIEESDLYKEIHALPIAEQAPVIDTQPDAQ